MFVVDRGLAITQLLRTIVLCVLIFGVVEGSFGRYSFGSSADQKPFQECMAKGDFPAAVKAGSATYESLKSAYKGSPVLRVCEERLAAIQDAKGLTVYKFNAVAQSANSSPASPFSYTSPTPEEFLKTARSRFAATRLNTVGLPDDKAAFLKAYVSASQEVANRLVISAYAHAIAAKMSAEASSKARAYLTAYVAGTQDDASISGMLALLEQSVTGGKVPLFLVEDLAGPLGDVKLASAVLRIFEKLRGAELTGTDKLRLYKLLAEQSERAGEFALAVAALNKVAELGQPSEAEEAMASMIRVAADERRDYSAAADACTKFVKRFPNSKDASTTEFLKALYENNAGNYDAALADIAAFRQRHSNSALTPSFLMLEGIVHAGKGEMDRVVAVCSDFLNKYPTHRLAGRAEFLIGFACFSGKKYGEARDAFQRVVDFYGQDEYASQAKDYLRTIEKQQLIPGK